jgi:hypothetical protein
MCQLKYPLLLVLVLLLSSAVPARTQERSDGFCAVRLTVTDAIEGKPAQGAIADLIDSSGHITESERVTNGTAVFCDFGFGRYSIHIYYQPTECASTEIKDVHVTYGLTQMLRAVLNTCGDEGEIGGNACSTYVRVAARDGRPLNGVEIKDASSIAPTQRTDRYGRAGLPVLLGKRAVFTFSLPGYKRAQLDLSCSEQFEGTTEASVVMEPE